MSYDYRHRSVWIDPLAPEPHPALYDLCERCAQRMSPPRSWVLTDRRDRQLFSAVS